MSRARAIPVTHTAIPTQRRCSCGSSWPCRVRAAQAREAATVEPGPWRWWHRALAVLAALVSLAYCVAGLAGWVEL